MTNTSKIEKIDIKGCQSGLGDYSEVTIGNLIYAIAEKFNELSDAINYLLDRENARGEVKKWTEKCICKQYQNNGVCEHVGTNDEGHYSKDNDGGWHNTSKNVNKNDISTKHTVQSEVSPTPKTGGLATSQINEEVKMALDSIVISKTKSEVMNEILQIMLSDKKYQTPDLENFLWRISFAIDSVVEGTRLKKAPCMSDWYVKMLQEQDELIKKALS